MKYFHVPRCSVSYDGAGENGIKDTLFFRCFSGKLQNIFSAVYGKTVEFFLCRSHLHDRSISTKPGEEVSGAKISEMI